MVDEPKELPAGIGTIFLFSSELGMKAVIKIVQAAADLNPEFGRADAETKRAVYAHGKSRTVLNFTSPSFTQRLGNPEVIMTLEVDDPLGSAQIAMMVYEESGLEPELIDGFHIDLGVPATFMYFVVTKVYPPLLFWPKNPDPKLVAHITPPLEPWRDDE